MPEPVTDKILYTRSERLGPIGPFLSEQPFRFPLALRVALLSGLLPLLLTLLVFYVHVSCRRLSASHYYL
jgi:hypothetical protein